MITFENTLNILKNDHNFREIIHKGEYNYNAPDITFKKISYDSRDVTASTLFFVKGDNFKKEFLEKAINTPRLETIPDQWTAQILARILVHHRVIFVSDLVDPTLITDMHMEIAKTFDEALARAFEIEGQDAKVTVIRDGLSVIVED